MNLDSMTQDELWAFWQSANGVRPITFAKVLFPTQPKGFVVATKLLRGYAANKATAMQCRLDGKINAAIMYEGICDSIYKSLPSFARTW